MIWDNLDEEKMLIPLLFELKYFEEINYLISSKKKFRANFSSEHFKKSILEFQHEIIIFFIKDNNFLSVLEEKSIQDFIVKEYFKY